MDVDDPPHPSASPLPTEMLTSPARSGSRTPSPARSPSRSPATPRASVALDLLAVPPPRVPLLVPVAVAFSLAVQVVQPGAAPVYPSSPGLAVPLAVAFPLPVSAPRAPCAVVVALAEPTWREPVAFASAPAASVDAVPIPVPLAVAKLLVKNVSPRVRPPHLEEIFAFFGRVVGVEVVPPIGRFRNGKAFVTFATPDDAETALEHMHEGGGAEIDGIPVFCALVSPESSVFRNGRGARRRRVDAIGLQGEHAP
ncbi:hypothetical protein H9P43_004890 [Blastocladiella emersonii ATCC 22665]|nr:hypothetical protein H9P43_004890 [Blastocladiella emersonii ATCC 22665]